jgi:hypothetical protein
MQWCLLEQTIQKIIYQTTPEGTNFEESAGRECYLELHNSLALQGHGRGVAQLGRQWATDLTCRNFNNPTFTISLLTKDMKPFIQNAWDFGFLEHNAEIATGRI